MNKKFNLDPECTTTRHRSTRPTTTARPTWVSIISWWKQAKSRCSTATFGAEFTRWFNYFYYYYYQCNFFWKNFFSAILLSYIHIYHRSNLANFLIPNIPKPVLWSSQVGESYGTMEGPRIKNSTFSKFQ